MIEKNLLSHADMTRWKGMPIFFCEAPEYSEHGCSDEFGHILATLDTGHAQADFHFGRKKQQHSLQAGDIGLFLRDQHADRVNWHCHQVRRIILSIDFSCLQDGDLIEDWQRKPLTSEIAFKDPELIQLLRAMRNEAAMSSPNGALYAQSLSLGAALRLIKRSAKTTSLDPDWRHGRLSTAQKQRVVDFLRANLASDIKLEQLSAVAGFSTSQFNRLFKKTFDQTPFEYLQRLRLDFVRLNLSTTQIPLAELATLAGYSSQSHMNTAFLRLHGITPGRYRRQ